MRRRILSLLIAFLFVSVTTVPAIAGGWASVTLKSEIASPVQEVPWTVEFLVKQHDTHPVDVRRAYLSATHLGTGERVTADAVNTGQVGSYAVTAVFPLAGEWTWSIIPEPFGGRSFATLTVRSGAKLPARSDAPNSHPAHVHSGTCDTLGDVVFPLGNVESSGLSATPAANPARLQVTWSETTLSTTLASLTGSNHAINVHLSLDEIGTYIACGTITGTIENDHLLVALGELNDSGVTGIAVLREDGIRTTITIYLIEAHGSDAT